MMRTTKLTLSVGSVLAITLTCFAQNDPTKQNDPNKPAKPGQPQIQRGDYQTDTRPFMAQRAKEVIGKSIVNAEGKTVGDVNDLLIDLPQGRIAGVIVGVGGVLGVGEEPRIVPPQALHWTANDGKLQLRMDEQLRTAKTRINDLKSYNELGQVYRDFQQEPYWNKDARQPVREREGRETDFRLRKAKEILGANVENASDKKLGEVEDLVIDLQSGRVVLVALGAGGILGVGEKLVAFPPSQLQMNAATGKLMINISEERLKSSPHFEKAHWPNLHDSTWVSQVYGHYGERSYWTPDGRQPVRERDLDKKP